MTFTTAAKQSTTIFLSPLRYPGGKRKLANFIKLVFYRNNLLDGEYAEPYAGGSGIGLSLLFEEYVQRIFINDIDNSVFAFWHSVLNETDALCRLIRDKPVTLKEWHRQKTVQSDRDASLLQKGFSTFFLNRTNRSGIISGGVIGGKAQNGKWQLDARYNKAELLNRVERIARYRDRIELSDMDAADFIRAGVKKFSERTLLYLDPPYFVKGRKDLYTNFYKPKDHAEVLQAVKQSQRRWIVSYDDVPQIRQLYKGFPHLKYKIHYSAQDRYRGAETMFFCSELAVPKIHNPARINLQEFRQYLS